MQFVLARATSIAFLFLLGLLVPAASARVARAQVAAGPTCDNWADDVVGPTERSLAPVAMSWTDGTPAGPADANGVRLTQPGQALIVDFGKIVSGKIEADVAAASGSPVIFSTSESLGFLVPGSDTQAYGNGDVAYQPGGGQETWHAFVRRTFRYLLVRLVQPGWVQFNRIGMYYTALLGPPSAYAGYFHSSDPLLDEIWFHSAYTLQLVNAAGSSSAVDGTLELWRGQLDMAANAQSRLLLASGGADWGDYTFDFDLSIPPGGTGGGWAIRASPQRFLGFRMDAVTRSLQVWYGTATGAAALVQSHPLGLALRSGRTYHVRADASNALITTSIDKQVVSTDAATGYTQGGIGFWAAPGDQFDVGHPRVFGADGTLLFEDTFASGIYLDPTRWPGAPQPVLLDGAKRDRALGVADLAIAARSEYLSFGNWEATGKLLALVGSHQYEDGKMPGGMLGTGSVSPEDAELPDYTFWWILALGDYVNQSGNLDTLDPLFGELQSALAWAAARRGPNGLLAKGPGEDWYWSAQRGSGPTTSLNALYVESLRVAADLANDRHNYVLHDQYAQQAAEVSEAINTNLWDATAGAYVDGDLRDHHPLDGNALVVRFGIAPTDRATQALRFLHDQLWTPAGTRTVDLPYGAWAQDGAVWPAYVIGEVEARFALHDDTDALDLVRRTWGSMLARDPSSTFWEFAMQDQSIHDGSTSLAHGWSTGALAALSRWVLGVKPLKPGYADYMVAPHPGGLTAACGAIPTPAGPIQISWERASGKFTASFAAPKGTTGEFVAPPGAADQAVLDGSAVQLVALNSTDRGLTDLPSGPHIIQLQLS